MSVISLEPPLHGIDLRHHVLHVLRCLHVARSKLYLSNLHSYRPDLCIFIVFGSLSSAVTASILAPGPLSDANQAQNRDGRLRLGARTCIDTLRSRYLPGSRCRPSSFPSCANITRHVVRCTPPDEGPLFPRSPQSMRHPPQSGNCRGCTQRQVVLFPLRMRDRSQVTRSDARNKSTFQPKTLGCVLAKAPSTALSVGVIHDVPCAMHVRCQSLLFVWASWHSDAPWSHRRQ